MEELEAKRGQQRDMTAQHATNGTYQFRFRHHLVVLLETDNELPVPPMLDLEGQHSRPFDIVAQDRCNSKGLSAGCDVLLVWFIGGCCLRNCGVVGLLVVPIIGISHGLGDQFRPIPFKNQGLGGLIEVNRAVEALLEEVLGGHSVGIVPLFFHECITNVLDAALHIGPMFIETFGAKPFIGVQPQLAVGHSRGVITDKTMKIQEPEDDLCEPFLACLGEDKLLDFPCMVLDSGLDQGLHFIVLLASLALLFLVVLHHRGQIITLGGNVLWNGASRGRIRGSRSRIRGFSPHLCLELGHLSHQIAVPFLGFFELRGSRLAHFGIFCVGGVC